ncbi:MAG: EAL domain-containing protein [Lachnospiraceae bacterium]|nr:EAL domain-containing protein [Lachnospiraceae bacterium]
MDEAKGSMQIKTDSIPKEYREEDAVELAKAAAAMEEHLNAIMQMNPTAMSTFRINLTKDTLNHGVSSYANLQRLQKKGTFSGYVSDALTFFPFEKEREEFARLYDRKNLLKLFKEEKYKVSMKHHYMLTDTRQQILLTIVSMVKNKVTEDIEGIVYTLDITRETYYSRINEVAFENSNLGITVVNIKRGTFIMPQFTTILEFDTNYEEQDYRKGVQQIVDDFVVEEEKEHYLRCGQIKNIVEHLDRDGKYSFSSVWVKNGKRLNMRLTCYYFDDMHEQFIGIAEDITDIIQREYKHERERMILEERSKRDSLTKVYNHNVGKELINDYLSNKTPYDTCGMMVLDIDWFKDANDNYGHLFGDEVLVKLSQYLIQLFSKKSIVMRAGGDEFVIFCKEVDRETLIQKVRQMMDGFSNLTFSEEQYQMSCSIGVCFLPENVSGYSYSQMFGNADWALYQAKEQGRNQYYIADSLQRYEENQMQGVARPNIDERYFRNDIVAAAFEIFEKQNHFESALDLLMEVIGTRLSLDRISVVRTHVREKRVSKWYQWRSLSAPKALEKVASYKKEDFLTLFHSFDEYGTTVLQWDKMEQYSDSAKETLMQGDAKTIVYAGMYSEGQYIGAIAYVSCNSKRYWPKQLRSQLGEVTKIIAAHLTRTQAINALNQSIVQQPKYDVLTGLISFAAFREEVEQFVLGGHASCHAMVSIDFYHFQDLNRKYGYAEGDRLLKDFSEYITAQITKGPDVYFTRVSADQFFVFLPYEQEEEICKNAKEIGVEFIKSKETQYPDFVIRYRMGVYFIQEDCSTSEAIDRANYARLQTEIKNEESGCCIYDAELEKRRRMESELMDEFPAAVQQKEFQIYYQPKYRLADGKMIGAEALSRWNHPEWGFLPPSEFIPLFERNGFIIKLDQYVCEEVCRTLKKWKDEGYPQIPVSVNISRVDIFQMDLPAYLDQLVKKYDIDPSCLHLEITERSYAKKPGKIFQTIKELRALGFKIEMDDFGKDYSSLHMMSRMELDTLKLDMAFIQSEADAATREGILRFVIELARLLKLHVVAEGVEKKEQFELLKNMGYDYVQGNFLAEPMPEKEFLKLFSHKHIDKKNQQCYTQKMSRGSSRYIL